ncbi:MAG: cobalamin B12-binding domain-containing protein [Deltaproteobacteria bacterium]|nr:cobalamin B12-binding domain-containing protein [Deltaproteobacteria bacterium]
MKVLLIQSYTGKGITPVFPIGLSYIAGSLEGHEVRGFDPNVEDNYLERLKAVLSDFAPDVIGFSLRNIWPFDEERGLYYKDAVIPLLRLIKSCGNYPVVMGGAGFTAYAAEIMEELPEVDFGIFREGEESFSQLLKNLGTPENVKGVYYKRGGKVCFTGPTKCKDLDNLPLPKRDIFDINKYLTSQGSIGVQTKRGCAFTCSYCIYPFLGGTKIVSRSTKRVVDEIEFLSNRFGIKDIVFVDTVFNVPMSQSQEICEELIRRKLDIKWTAWFHPKHMTEDFVRLCVRAGCYLFEFSPDAYTDKMLKLLQKNITNAEITNTYRIMKKVDGANISYNFFVNGPGEDIVSFIRLLLFFIKAKLFLRHKLKRFFFSHLHIEPNTELFKLASEKGMIDRNARFLGSKVAYEKMIYKNSMLVDKSFNSLWVMKNVFKTILTAGR